MAEGSKLLDRLQKPRNLTEKKGAKCTGACNKTVKQNVSIESIPPPPVEDFWLIENSVEEASTLDSELQRIKDHTKSMNKLASIRLANFQKANSLQVSQVSNVFEEILNVKQSISDLVKISKQNTNEICRLKNNQKLDLLEQTLKAISREASQIEYKFTYTEMQTIELKNSIHALTQKEKAKQKTNCTVF